MLVVAIVLSCVCLTLSSPIFDHFHDRPQFPVEEPFFPERYLDAESLPETDFYDARSMEGPPRSPNLPLDDLPEQPEFFPPPPPSFFVPPPPPAAMPLPPRFPPFLPPPPPPFLAPLPQFRFGPLAPAPLSPMPNLPPGPIVPVGITTIEYRVLRTIVHPAPHSEFDENLPSIKPQTTRSESYEPEFFPRPDERHGLFDEHSFEPESISPSRVEQNKEFQPKKDLPYVPPSFQKLQRNHEESNTVKTSLYTPPAFEKFLDQDSESRSNEAARRSSYTPPAFVKLLKLGSESRSSKPTPQVLPVLEDEVDEDSPAEAVLRSSKVSKRIPYKPPSLKLVDDFSPVEAKSRSSKKIPFVPPALKFLDTPLVSSSEEVSDILPAEKQNPGGKHYEIHARFPVFKDDSRGDQPNEDDQTLVIVVD